MIIYIDEAQAVTARQFAVYRIIAYWVKEAALK